MTNQPEDRVSLGEAAYRRLRDDIVTCRLAPGQRLTERQLSADTGFGISPLREALTRLDHDGLVRTLPRKGYQVTPMTPKSIDDLFVMWEIVGPELVRLGVRNASAEQIERAVEVFGRLDELRASNGPDAALAQVELSHEAFAVLAAATGNSQMINLFDRIASELSRVWVLVLESDADAAALDDAGDWAHRLLPERDADRAAETARRYIRAVHERVLRAITRWPSIMQSEVVPLHRPAPPGHLGD